MSDADAIVQELVSAYSKKTEKYEKAQTKLSWKQVFLLYVKQILKRTEWMS